MPIMFGVIFCSCQNFCLVLENSLNIYYRVFSNESIDSNAKYKTKLRKQKDITQVPGY
jgi:hypothetical protein